MQERGPCENATNLFSSWECVGTEPTLWPEGLGFWEVGWINVVAVGDAGDGSLVIVRRENGQSVVIYTPAGILCPHSIAPPSGTTLGILCACEPIGVYV